MEEEEFFVTKSDTRNGLTPYIVDEKKRFKLRRQSILVNLCVFALLTALFSILFMYTLAKKSKEQDLQITTIFPFHNPKNRSQLLCPTGSSFDIATFTCKQCPSFCDACYHELQVRCARCFPTHYLSLAGQCVTQCPTNIYREGFCHPEQPGNYQLIDLESGNRIQQLVNVAIYNYSSQNLLIVMPHLGETQAFLPVKYFSLARDLNATVAVCSMPHSEVLYFQDADPNDAKQEQLRFIDKLAHRFLEQLKLAQTVRIVVMGDSVFFGHELAQMMYVGIKQDLCNECKIVLTILQTKELPVLEEIRMGDDALSNLLSYMYELRDIRHRNNGSLSLVGEASDITEQVVEFRKNLRYDTLFKAAYNQEIDVEAFVEVKTPEIQDIYKDFRMKSFREMRVQLQGDAEMNLVQLFHEIVRAT